MTEPPDTHAFPANKLGAFLRAMADPEGTGAITATSEHDIAKIEARLSEVHRDDGSAERTD
ncbi:MAG TPA: hypothetical protein VK501_16590 [Baekduia sp.]|uniref:hypothetical protein n=1 Tax=Baekduia sp. TaxID=2600305 RepID=UPI002BC3F4E0|nr:hypothetical protein [Baekduia sp.]HMJ35528.1 hypothetical protein [Baekduia sp.]